MTNKWSYHNLTKIIFGAGCLGELPSLVAGAENILLVTTPGFTRRGMTETVCRMLRSGEDTEGRSLSSVSQITVLDNVQPNPDLDSIEADFRRLCAEDVPPGSHAHAQSRTPVVDRRTHPDPEAFPGDIVVIGLGGGSAIDTAKVFSYLLANKNTALREQFESAKPFNPGKTVPFIAVPTTAGTGSEVTPFATVWDKLKHKKYSLATPHLFPDTALLDPSLTLTLPEEITVYTALDALSHAFESYWNNNRNPVSAAYAVRSIGTIMKTLPALLQEPQNIDYRSDIMEASLFSGLAISTTRTALAHSISYPVTSRFGMPHGLACSFTLSAILQYNAAGNEKHFRHLAQSLGCANTDELQKAIEGLFQTLQVKEVIKKYISSTDALLALTPEMFTPGRADNNLRPIEEDGIKTILLSSL